MNEKSPFVFPRVHLPAPVIGCVVVPLFWWSAVHWHASQTRPLAELRQCESHLHDLATALQDYAGQHHGHYPQFLGELTPRYLQALPTCPSSQESYQYRMSPRTDQFTLFCSGANHARAFTKRSANYPAYSSKQGPLEPP